MNLFFDWHDPVEIIFFVTIIYSCIQWLNKDRQTNLAYYFYVYLSSFCGAYFFGLSAISSTLLIMAPVAIVASILFHQQILQKQLIALKRFTPRIPETLIAWDNLLIKTLLQQLNQQKTIYVVVERSDSLAADLKIPFLLDVPLQEELFATLLASLHYQEHQLVWITQSGKLMSINASWNRSESATLLLSGSEQIAWKEYAAVYTTKTDALVIKSNPATRTVSLIAQGACVDDLTPAQAHALIRKYCFAKKDSVQKKDYYASDIVQKHTQQSQQ